MWQAGEKKFFLASECGTHIILPQAFPDHSPFQPTHVPGKKTNKQNQEAEVTHSFFNTINSHVLSLFSYIQFLNQVHSQQATAALQPPKLNQQQ